jgi:hypothetical protein
VNGTSTSTASWSPKISVEASGEDTIGLPSGSRWVRLRGTPSFTNTSYRSSVMAVFLSAAGLLGLS